MRWIIQNNVKGFQRVGAKQLQKKGLREAKKRVIDKKELGYQNIRHNERKINEN